MCAPKLESSFMSRPAKTAAIRHVVSINDLTNTEIEYIFEAAQAYLDDLADKSLPYRIARSTTLGAKCILASLFYEPSTRTRLSFESAMLRSEIKAYRDNRQDETRDHGARFD